MWSASRAPQRPSRTGSVHSVVSVHSVSRPSSISSQRRSGYESDQSSDTAGDDEFIQNINFPMAPTSTAPSMWGAPAQLSPSASRLSQKLAHANISVAEIHTSRHEHDNASSPDDDARSRGSTLGGEEQDFEFPEKTPTMRPKVQQLQDDDDEAETEPEKPHVPGPLEQQLSALMSKLIFMERENPTVSVSPEEFQSLQDRVNALEAEKKTWQKRHEALFALRDEDVENNIKIRGLLAKERREHEALKKLRDEDLQNVLIVRSKLAESTRKLEKYEKEANTSGGRSPSSGRRITIDRRSTSMDLFAVAKAAALEQRALELEKRNEDLLAQIETLKGGSANIDDLNRMTAHKAWKDTVELLESKLKIRDAEIAKLKSAPNGVAGTTVSAAPSAAPSPGIGMSEWSRIEAVHEDHARYREKVGQRIQALRSENEGLLRDLHRKEDECHELESRVEKLRRRVTMV